MQLRRSRSWPAWAASACLHAVIAVLVWRGGDRGALRLPMMPEREMGEVDFEIAPAAGDPSPLPSPRGAGRGEKKEKKAAPSMPTEGGDPSPLPSPRGAGRG